MKNLVNLIMLFATLASISAQDLFEVNGLCIKAPSSERLDEFVTFVDKTLAPAGINTLILRVDYNYAYESRPELRGKDPMTKAQVKKLVAVCKKNQIEIIPQVNLLGHQSWAENVNLLLEVYPEFDETPHIEMPKDYKWPNDDGLYCKSYCPLHPEVHDVVFDLMDEIVEVYEAKSFHAGLDEVFYLADENCPRCQGKDPARLFADEVSKISNHLKKNDARLWIWGDRLLDGSMNGIGLWEGSFNNTARAIDMIPTSVIIADWHYVKAMPTPAYFAYKGFDVVACPWRIPEVAEKQVDMMYDFKHNSPDVMASKIKGVMHTVWTSAERFMDTYKDHKSSPADTLSQVATFKAMTNRVKELEKK